jgi:hypothetical protein
MDCQYDPVRLLRASLRAHLTKVGSIRAWTTDRKNSSSNTRSKTMLRRHGVVGISGGPFMGRTGRGGTLELFLQRFVNTNSLVVRR